MQTLQVLLPDCVRRTLRIANTLNTVLQRFQQHLDFATRQVHGTVLLRISSAGATSQRNQQSLLLLASQWLSSYVNDLRRKPTHGPPLSPNGISSLARGVLAYRAWHLFTTATVDNAAADLSRLTILSAKQGTVAPLR
jgi:hypothetical protein